MSETVSVAIVSDTHGYLDERVAAIVAECDYALHAGDICGAGVLEEMRPRRRVIAVRGNNDVEGFWPAGEDAILAEIPQTATLDLPGGTLAMEHGHKHGFNTPSHDSLRLSYPAASVVVYGHTHIQVCDTETTPWVLNPGASGQTRTRGGPGCLVLYAGPDEWRVVAHRFEN